MPSIPPFLQSVLIITASSFAATLAAGAANHLLQRAGLKDQPSKKAEEPPAKKEPVNEL